MIPKYRWLAAVVLLFGSISSCSRPETQGGVLAKFGCDSREGVIQQVGVTVDNRIKKEGEGSLRFAVGEPAVLRLFETGDIDIENAVLVYQANLRTEDVQGRVYLEMWCHFEGKGEFFSRGIDRTVSGTVKWTQLEIPFALKSGENPDNVKLNLVCEGSGTVWVDDIRMVKRAG
ncbi:MAG: hypothetical protein JXE07_05590 [Candidatus Aminicenantes bacterium]|nr:hypothetical protein [Candidatus Aminicenantes bacterium]